MPLVSVVVPTHNRPEMLAETLASVQAQTFVDYEIIVVSNGESPEMRGQSQAVTTLVDARWFALDEGNVSAARNFGIARAKGEWIAFLDDDDLWLPHKLERQVTEAHRTRADMISADYIEFYPDGRQLRRQARLIEGWTHVQATNHQYFWALPSAVMVRKVALDAVGGFDSALRYCEDNDLWRRISWRHSIHQIEEVLVHYRQGHPSAVRDKRECYRYDLHHYRKMHHDTPSNLRWALPSFTTFVVPRLIGIYAPQWLLDVLTSMKPRYCWILFRQWLRPQSRLKEWRSR